MFLVKKDFVLNVKSCDIRPILIKSTDHQAVSIQLQSVSSETRGPGYWKINNGILNEQEYEDKINKIIQKHSNEIGKN